tara:strand:- start:2715 stop:3224 length:510 start_codon:yes stop_codon:yes gene_type:complete
MTVIENPIQFRSNIVSKLCDILEDEKKTKHIETSVYNYAIKESRSKEIIIKWENPMFVHIYLDRLRTIYMNMKNPEFLEQLKSGEITPKALESMTHQEMNPQRWSKLIEMKIKRNESRYDNKAVASTDMFTCRKCKSKKCTYYEMQTRSADEPSTIFVTCLDCGKNWKS